MLFGLKFAEYQEIRIIMSNYLITTSVQDVTSADVIHDVNSRLKVRAINLLHSVFTPSKGEVRFFVTAGDNKVAFETKGYRRHREDLILHMISWYCVYSGWLDNARIHLTMPY